MIKNIILSILIIMYIWANTYAQNSISLSECIEAATLHSPLAATLPLIRENESLQYQQLQTNYLPQTSLNGQVSWQSQVTSLPIKLPNLNIEAPAKDQYKLTLDVTQNVWDGGTTKAQQNLQAANARAEEMKVISDIYGLKEQVSSLYFSVLLVDKQKNLLLTSKKDLNTKIAKIQGAVDNGTAIKANIWSLEARMMEIDQQLFDLQNRKISALNSLTLLTGKTFTEDISLDAPIISTTNLSEIDRPEIHVLEAQQQALAVNSELIKAKNMPKVSAFATGGYGRPGFNFLSRDFQFYAIVGAQVKVPLSHFYTKTNVMENAQIEVGQKKMEQQKQNILLATKVRLSAQQQEVTRLNALIETDNKLIAMREKIRQTVEVQWENGIITNNEYIAEVNNEELAKQNKILHEVQLLQAIFMQQIIAGK